MSMSDITIWDEDLAEGLDELEGRVRQLSKKSGGAKQEVCARAACSCALRLRRR